MDSYAFVRLPNGLRFTGANRAPRSIALDLTEQRFASGAIAELGGAATTELLRTYQRSLGFTARPLDDRLELAVGEGEQACELPLLPPFNVLRPSGCSKECYELV
jgi:hypothetical protein